MSKVNNTNCYIYYDITKKEHLLGISTYLGCVKHKIDSSFHEYSRHKLDILENIQKAIDWLGNLIDLEGLSKFPEKEGNRGGVLDIPHLPLIKVSSGDDLYVERYSEEWESLSHIDQDVRGWDACRDLLSKIFHGCEGSFEKILKHYSCSRRKLIILKIWEYLERARMGIKAELLHIREKYEENLVLQKHLDELKNKMK